MTSNEVPFEIIIDDKNTDPEELERNSFQLRADLNEIGLDVDVKKKDFSLEGSKSIEMRTGWDNSNSKFCSYF